MYKGYRVISTTPAGRVSNLQLLNRHLINFSNLIDEHHFWINTTCPEDIEYIYNTCKNNSFFKFVEPKIPIDWIYSIYHFFKEYTDPNTIYLRFDDDICYIAPDAINNLLDFRIEHPEFFLVYPVIINNAMNEFLDNDIMRNIDGNWFEDKEHILKKHYIFLELIKNGKIDLVKTNDYILDHTQRVNINCISWFGKEFAKFNGTVGIEEEEWLSRTAPKEFNKNNAICGNSVVAHYGFRTQKKFLDKTNVLNEYKKLMSINIKLN